MKIMANVLEKNWISYFELLSEDEKKSILSLLKTFFSTAMQMKQALALSNTTEK